MKILLISLLLAAASAPVAVRADSDSRYSGLDLWNACGQSTQGPVPNVCAAYVAGVDDMRWYYAGRHPGSPPLYCEPAATDGQIADVVRKYLHGHPETRIHAAAYVVVDALEAAFPCPAK